MLFQSAPLLRGAIKIVTISSFIVFVSIRAPLARGDHRPDGTRERNEFQSAPLLRGAIPVSLCSMSAILVSIRAPLARGDENEEA